MEGDIAALRTACLVLNTADYCQVTASEVGETPSTCYSIAPSDFDTTTQLEDKMKEKISEEFRENVSLQNERDLFVRLVLYFLNPLPFSTCFPA